MAEILFFGDSADVDSIAAIRNVISKRERPTLVDAFLNHASSFLRTSIAGLPPQERQQIPAFVNLREFIAAYSQQERRHVLVDGVLLCIAQLAHFLTLVEERPDFFSRDGIINANSSIIGISSGLVAAAAASCLASGGPYIPIALEAVRIAFRLGVYVSKVASRLEPAPEPDAVWSVALSGLSESEVRFVLDELHAETDIPEPNRVYISAVGSSSVTVSGPPGSLRRLLDQSDALQHVAKEKVPVYGPYHAPHLHGDCKIEDILHPGAAEVPEILLCKPALPVISQSGGAYYSASSLGDLFEQVIGDVLIQCEDLDAIVDECGKIIATSDCRMLPVVSSKMASEITASLRKRTSINCALLDSELEQIRPAVPTVGIPEKEKIAIVGMSGRFPGGQDLDEFWNILQKGLDMHREVPPDRFDAKAHTDPSGKGRNKSHTPFGCFVDNAGLFDPRFFNMSPREAAQTDPMQRLALITAYEALEMAGYVPNRTPSTRLDRIGTFYGQTSDDWREINEAQDIDTYFITGGVRAFGPGRINYHFKFSGPSFNVDTACSSSMAALHMACNSLWAGDCDTAITGGLNIMTNPDIFAGLSKGQFLSKVGPCQTFDNDADGYCRGDGIGTLILKRLTDAQADKDNILGVILATATNHSAEAISITHPHGKTQEILYRKVLDQAGVDPREICYVEMHGTGTQAGDGTEMGSVSDVFAPAVNGRAPHQKLYLGSVKANVGHGEAASGVTAMVKTLLMLRKNMIPPHVGIKREINKGFPDLAARNAHIAFSPTSLPREPGQIRKVFVNNFSAAGGNTAVVLEDGPIRQLKGTDPRKMHIVSVSARALSSFKANLRSLAGYLDSNPNVHLPSLSYTTMARRIHHSYRRSFIADSVQSLKKALLDAAERDTVPVPSSPRIAFCFTGQGASYARLAGDLFETSAHFRDSILEFDHVAISFGFPSFLPLIDGSAEDVSVLSPVIVQVGLTSIQMALTRLWASWGVTPDVVMGHSLGEYAALYAASVLSASDTIYLVGSRAQLLESRCTAGSHAMLAVKSGVSALGEFVASGQVEIACINSPTEVVLSGPSSAIDTCKAALQQRGLKTTKLNVPYAFHSSQVDAILPEYERIASAVAFRSPKCAVISPLLGGVLADGQIDANYLCRHAREAVNFLAALDAGTNAHRIDEQTLFVEIGPHPVCVGFVKSTLNPSVSVGHSLRRNDAAWNSLASTASLLHNKGANILWSEYHRDFEDALELLELPAYNWALANYWIQYKNNWCLTKGEDTPTLTLAPPVPSLSTTSVQQVIEESFSENQGRMVAESDITRPDLYPAVSSHQVNGIALCPSSIYGDIGVTIGQYMYRRLYGLSSTDAVPPVNVRNMEIPKTLIAKEGGPQILRIVAEADKAKGYVDITLSTKEGEHAQFVAEFGNASDWQAEWQRTSYLVEGRIETLKSMANEHKAHTLLQNMAYRLFATFVDYGETYQGMKKVTLDSEHNEATAEVILETLSDDKKFVIPPYWIDSVGHLGGFIMNVGDKKNVFVSHGWESMRFAKPLESGKQYQTYVRMLPIDGTKIVRGDVYCFEGSTVIGMIGGLKFQCIPRQVLNLVLPPAGAASLRAASKGKEQQVPQEQPRPVTATRGQPASKAAEPRFSTTSTPTVSVASQVLAIIADECGIDISELADPNSFADLGVDSLMQLSISSRMREELEIEVSSSLFIDYPTVGTLKAHLNQSYPEQTPTAVASDVELGSSSQSDSDDLQSSPSLTETTPSTTPAESERDRSEGDLLKTVGQKLAKHCERSLGSSNEPTSEIVVKPFRLPPMLSNRRATSFLLQGNPKTAKTTLFLIPDGSGTAASYVPIPVIGDDVVVYGLNSPFMTTPQEYTCGVPGITEYFLSEIRKRQPHGPYNIGGWSAGGVVSFEAVTQLIRAGEKVDRLILIDSPSPLTITPLPDGLHRWFNGLGLLGDGNPKKTPEWLLPHFQASVNALSTYYARSLDFATAPKTFVIWCEDGVCKYPTDPRPDPYPSGHALFLLEDKTDFGPQLWDAMVGVENVVTSRVPGNHFTMMMSPNIEILGDEIRKAMLS